MQLTDFYTRAAGNAGIRCDLFGPDGEKTAHWLKIRSTDSDAFRQALAFTNTRFAQLSELASKPDAEQAQLFEQRRVELLAALVAEWSFDEPLTPESAQNLMREAPQIADYVDKLASNRRLFLRRSFKSSTPTQPPTSA